jgi:predicted TIM-barrel fold metal-dependent hydrolase
VRGIRYILNWHENPRFAHVDRADIMTDPVWLSNFARLASLGLSFDLQVFPSQLLDAASLAAAHPDTSIVLDHAGMPIRRDSEGFDQWRAGMVALAANPNVSVKVSALGTNDHHWTRESIRPFVWETIEIFGTDRTMFGSNFPVDSLYSTLHELYAAFDELTMSLSRPERVQLFASTAARFYRIE